MPGDDCPGADGQAPENSGHFAANSRGAGFPRARLDKSCKGGLGPRGAFLNLFVDSTSGQTSTWKADGKKPGFMLMEDIPLNAHSETQIATECRMDEVIVGSGPLTSPPTAPPTAYWGAGGVVHSECPGAWGGSNCSATDFERAYRMYSRRVYSKCLHMVGNEAEAEDLTQEVFLQLFRKMDTFRGESAFSTWLYRLAVNVVLMRLRRKSLSTSSLEEVIGVQEGSLSLQQVLGAPDSALSTAIDRLNLERAVSQMPAGYKQVFLLHYLEGYGHREIARLLGLSIGTSKSQLYKARVRLRQLLRRGESKQWQGGVSRWPPQVLQGAGGRSKRSRRASSAGSCG